MMARVRAWLYEQFGRQWPPVLFFDVETTGLRVKSDLVWQIGHAFLKDNAIADIGAYVINWTNEPRVNPDQLIGQIHKVCQAMEAQGKPYYLSWDRLRDTGLPPGDVLGFYHDLLARAVANGAWVCAHNGLRFDVPIMTTMFDIVLGRPWPVPDDRLIDTLAIERAARYPGPQTLPRPDDTVISWCDRLTRMPLRVGPLDGELAERYNFRVKYGWDPRDVHEADRDAELTAWLWQEHVTATAPPAPAPLPQHQPPQRQLPPLHRQRKDWR